MHLSDLQTIRYHVNQQLTGSNDLHEIPYGVGLNWQSIYL